MSVARCVALIDYTPSGHTTKLTPDQREKALADRIGQAVLPGKVSRGGTLEITSGCLALLMPFAQGDFTADQLAAVRRGTAQQAGWERILVPLDNGTYEVVAHPFGDEDELGRYGHMIRIVRGTSGTKTGTKTETPAKAATTSNANATRNRP